MMTVGTVDIAPTISNGERMYTHVVVCIEIDTRNIITRIANEHITTAVHDKERVVIRRITMRVCPRYRTPIGISI